MTMMAAGLQLVEKKEKREGDEHEKSGKKIRKGPIVVGPTFVDFLFPLPVGHG